MKIFDTHTHLNVEEFAGREAEELRLAAEMGVSNMNVVGFDRPTIERALELADSYEQIYATIGWHPTEAGTYDEAVEAYLLDNQQQLPSPLENIDSSLVDLFIENLKEINIDFYNHLEEIKGFVKNDCPPSKNTALQTLESLGLLGGR